MTSIEWLIDKLGISEITHKKLFEQAKEMHKQEIIDAYTEGRFNYEDFDRGLVKLKQPKEYYQKTFNNKNGTSNQTT
jgi:hypothetical protein